MIELLALNQHRPQAALSQLFNSRVNRSRFSATSIHHLTYNNKYLNYPKAIAQAFGRYFAPSLTTDIKLPTSRLPCPSSETFSKVSFLPKETTPLAEKA